MGIKRCRPGRPAYRTLSALLALGQETTVMLLYDHPRNTEPHGGARI